jgi:sulfite oxidase
LELQGGLASLEKDIKYCGGLKDPSASNHLEFLGADIYFKKGEVFNYAVSVSWRKASSAEYVRKATLLLPLQIRI